MKHINTIFHQLLTSLPKHRFQSTVDRHKGDYQARTLRCWDQLVILLFAQFSNRVSLRDTVETFNSKKHQHYHLGVSNTSRSTLSDANNKRPVQIYKESFFYLLNQVRELLPSKESNQMIRLVDSTTIDLNLNQYKWAQFRTAKSGIKIHTVYDPNAKAPVFFEITHAKAHDKCLLKHLAVLPNTCYVVDRAYNDYTWYNYLEQQRATFVTRMKSNARFDVIEYREVQGEGVISDQVIKFSAQKAKADCPIELRRIEFIREQDGKKLVFLSNKMDVPAEQIAALYKQRWEIELFFKWIKQNLKISKFFGRSENAVMIQIMVAMIAYLLIRLAQLKQKSGISMHRIARLISVNLTSKRDLWELLMPVQKRPPKIETSSTQGCLQLAFS